MRIRTIKPEFFLHDGIFDAEREEGLPLRIAFIGLWCAADREGRFRWEPRRLGAAILPYDLLDFSRVLDALTTRGFIEKHACPTGEFGVIPSFTRHQIVNNRETPSILPSPTLESIVEPLPTRAPRVPDACPTPESGREGKGTGREQEGNGSFLSAQPPKPAKVADPMIETIYQAYPQKAAKIEALRAIEKAMKAAGPEHLLERVQAYAAAIALWPKEERDQFVPMCATWMNKGRWTDDPETWKRKGKALASDQRFLFTHADYANSQPLSSDRNR